MVQLGGYEDIPKKQERFWRDLLHAREMELRCWTMTVLKSESQKDERIF